MKFDTNIQRFPLFLDVLMEFALSIKVKQRTNSLLQICAAKISCNFAQKGSDCLTEDCSGKLRYSSIQRGPLRSPKNVSVLIAEVFQPRDKEDGAKIKLKAGDGDKAISKSGYMQSMAYKKENVASSVIEPI